MSVPGIYCYADQMIYKLSPVVQLSYINPGLILYHRFAFACTIWCYNHALIVGSSELLYRSNSCKKGLEN